MIIFILEKIKQIIDFVFVVLFVIVGIGKTTSAIL